MACGKGDTALGKILLAMQADVQIESRSGATPLMAAAFMGNSEHVAALLSAGAKADLTRVMSASCRLFCNRFGLPPLGSKLFLTHLPMLFDITHTTIATRNRWSSAAIA